MTNISQAKFKNYSTKDKIICIAERLFTKYSYATVSMNDIANMVKTTKAALYYHFKDKEELFFYVLNEAFSEFSEALEQVLKKDISLEKKFNKLLITYIDFSLKRKDLAKLMMQGLSKKDKKIIQLLGKIKNKIIDLIEPLIKEILQYRGFSKSTDSRLVTFLIIGVLNTVITSDIVMKYSDWDAEQIADQITALVFSTNK
ncbi:MAG: TetR/AcrR family transcriptional regulator [bacterium]|nr:TetR/AcrR family transcriptional regulator [bacterium]